ncbi:PQQ-like beta-propeller repeat protein [Candidatus Sumerlaeota bacterium]|nr:PQQ-like beta-propeller repeat protein [Candidatus Sumerlaeota bacterium]
MSQAKLDEQRRLLPTKAYERLWENKWTEGSGSFITRDEVMQRNVLHDAGGLEVGITAGYSWTVMKWLQLRAGLGANAIPTPVTQDGMVYVMTGFRPPRRLMAIRLGHEGDLTGTDAVVWTVERGTSYTPSPVLHENKLYMLMDSGMISCVDATSGEPYYMQQRLPGSPRFKASPVGAQGKLYLASEGGEVFVLKMGPDFEVLATNTLDGQSFVASPAIVDGELFLRSQSNLICVAQAPSN